MRTCTISKLLAIAPLLAIAISGTTSAQTNLPAGIFIAIPPCRVIDTRNTAAHAFAANETRTFNIVGTFNTVPQGGTSTTGCGISPFFTDLLGNNSPGAVAVEINYVAINPAGAGNLKAWPTDQAVPTTSIINFQKLTPNLNIANGTVTGVRQDVQGNDITIRASQAVDVVADVVAFYALPGFQNSLPGYLATVNGGFNNTAKGAQSAVAGGIFNFAGGDFSFAAGSVTNINPSHHGTFLFADDVRDVADSNIPPFNSLAAKEFAARATGGFRFVTAIDNNPASGTYGQPTSSCNIPTGGALSCSSDRNVKENVASVDQMALLAKLAAIPVQTWSYKAEPGSVRHIGPMAQDFKQAFGVGGDDTHISTVDAEGVALSGIQGLYRMVQAQAVRLDEKDKQIAELKALVVRQSRQISGLEAQRSAEETRLESLEKTITAIPVGAERVVSSRSPVR